MTEQSTSRDWSAEYSAVLRRLGVNPDGDEGKRVLPRINFNPPEKILLVHLGSHTGVLRDISAGGISFHLNLPLTAERQVNLSIDNKFRAKVKIVSSVLEDYEDQGFRDTYRNRTKFLEETEGYRCMVQALKLYSMVPTI